jgi:hypothetical protein
VYLLASALVLGLGRATWRRNKALVQALDRQGQFGDGIIIDW